MSWKSIRNRGRKRGTRRKAKDRAVQSHKTRNVRPTHSQTFFPLRTGPGEECCVTGYERLLGVHRDLRTELLVGMTSKVQPVTESNCGRVCVCLGWGKIVEGDDVLGKVEQSSPGNIIVLIHRCVMRILIKTKKKS